MNIHELMQRFAQVGSTTIGKGPKHPTSPNSESLPEIEKYFASHPILKQDQGYVDFLECYSAASADGWLDGKIFIHIFGFDTNITSHLGGPDEWIFDTEKGFCSFAYIQIPKPHLVDDGCAYSFDITGLRSWGVYKSSDTGDIVYDYEWYCGSFLEWLEDIIEKQGLL